MIKRSQTKKTLIVSIISAVICLAMLEGTTFAWFTDSVTSGDNVIISGNLDVELYHKNANVTADNASVQGNTALFCDKDGNVVKWEPGVVSWENFTVSNVGTLDLKYLLTVKFEDKNYIERNGVQYKLSDVLEIAYVDGGVDPTKSRAELIAGITSWQSLSTYVGEIEELSAGTDSSVIGVVIYWAPGANDNNYNVNNGATTNDGDPLGIKLNVELKATQLTSENDAFGDNYDQNAYLKLPTATVTQLTGNELNISLNGMTLPL